MLNFKETIEDIDGWLTEAEGLFLYETAKMIKPDDVIVEIGSWEGKSTICLGKGTQDGGKTSVYAVDPHTGSSEHRKIVDYPIDTYNKFADNVKNAGVARYIRPIRLTSEEASKDFHKPIGFLFIDGAHEFKWVNLDYKLWFPKVMEGGTIAFHDSWHFPGPHCVTAGLLFFSRQIKNPKLTDTITSFTKVRENSFEDRLYNIGFFFYRLLAGPRGYLRLRAGA